MPKRLLRVVAVPSLVLALAACTGGGAPAPDDVAPLWASEIERILAGSPSDLEKRALADGKISEAELNEAMNAFKDCMEELPHGFAVTLLPDGGFDIGPLDPYYSSFSSEEEAAAAYDELLAGCEAGTTGTLGPLHAAMRDNPEGRSPIQMIRDCFQRHDVPDGAELTDDAFAELLQGSDYVPSTPWAQSCLIDSESEVLLEDIGEQIGLDAR